MQILTLGVDLNSYVLNELDLGFPTVRAVSQSSPGRDGDADTTRYVGPRAVTARVTVVGGNTGPLVDGLAAVMHPGMRNYLHVTRPDWAAERRIQVRGETFTCPPGQGGSLRVAQLGWRAPLGLWEDATAQTVMIQPTGSSTGGFSFPLVFPLAMTPGQAAGSTLVTMGGMVPSSVLCACTGRSPTRLCAGKTPGSNFRSLAWSSTGAITCRSIRTQRRSCSTACRPRACTTGWTSRARRGGGCRRMRRRVCRSPAPRPDRPPPVSLLCVTDGYEVA